MNHTSDLALERLLNNEPLPEVHDHLHDCDLCWQRWQHLHADEGMTLPERQARPTPANRQAWLPWTLVGAATVVAMAAVSMLTIRPDSAAVERLQEEVALLQVQLEEAPRAAPRTVPAERLRIPAERRPVDDAPVTIPPEVLEAAVQREIEKRTLQKMDDTRDVVQEKSFAHIGKTMDRFVADGLVTDGVAGDVERLLQRELEETWEIKAGVATGDLSEEDAWADWEAMVGETDEALLRFVDREVLDELRAELNGK